MIIVVGWWIIPLLLSVALFIVYVLPEDPIDAFHWLWPAMAIGPFSLIWAIYFGIRLLTTN
jgi:hypothetical protein